MPYDDVFDSDAAPRDTGLAIEDAGAGSDAFIKRLHRFGQSSSEMLTFKYETGKERLRSTT